MRRVAILGSTGSIGRSTLEVAASLPSQIEIVGLAAGADAASLAEQARRWRPRAVALADAGRAAELREGLRGAGIAVWDGREGVERIAALAEADLVVAAIVGVAGLRPTVAAIAAGKDVALANKETLVAAGGMVTALARARGVRLIPVDSEHAAVAQALEGRDPALVARIVLTASGGPFLRRPLADMARVTVDEALRHPTWRMGAKVTVDSATLMNKALEVIEAHWLFGLPSERIGVLIHPQSVVHGLVEFTDGSALAQLAPPDMRLPIQRALTAPAIVPTAFPALAWDRPRALELEPVDPERFPALDLGRRALRDGGTAPAVLNAANEAAVGLFLARRLAFPRIVEMAAAALAAHRAGPADTLEQVLAADRWARDYIAQAAEVRA